MEMNFSFLDLSKNLKTGSDEYVKDQLMRFNFGEYDFLKGQPLYYNVKNEICKEMDVRKLWAIPQDKLEWGYKFPFNGRI